MLYLRRAWALAALSLFTARVSVHQVQADRRVSLLAWASVLSGDKGRFKVLSQRQRLWIWTSEQQVDFHEAEVGEAVL